MSHLKGQAAARQEQNYNRQSQFPKALPYIFFYNIPHSSYFYNEL